MVTLTHARGCSHARVSAGRRWRPPSSAGRVGADGTRLDRWYRPGQILTGRDEIRSLGNSGRILTGRDEIRSLGNSGRILTGRDEIRTVQNNARSRHLFMWRRSTAGGRRPPAAPRPVPAGGAELGPWVTELI